MLLRAAVRARAGTRGFRALIVERSAKEAAGASTSAIYEVGFDRLGAPLLPRQDPKASVEVSVTHSTLNYKDGMIVLGQKGVTKGYPIVPGIDFAGRVRRSSSPLWSEGDEVVLTGNKAGQFFDGGYAERATCAAEWLVPRREPFTLAQSMAIGSAGHTAAMCVRHLETAGGLRPHGKVLVTGAAGGLGQVAVALLSARGYEVVASTGRVGECAARLVALGASEVIGRLPAEPRPLGSQLWAGVVDSVGGATLAAAIAQTSYRGAVASTGVAGGGKLSSTVYPFILRGVRLLGVDSTLPWDLEGYPADPARWAEFRQERLDVWDLLADSLSPAALAIISPAGSSIGLEQLPEYAQRILDGKVAGRVVVDVAQPASDYRTNSPQRGTDDRKDRGI